MTSIPLARHAFEQCQSLPLSDDSALARHDSPAVDSLAAVLAALVLLTSSDDSNYLRAVSAAFVVASVAGIASAVAVLSAAAVAVAVGATVDSVDTAPVLPV